MQEVREEEWLRIQCSYSPTISIVGLERFVTAQCPMAATQAVSQVVSFPTI